MMRADLEKYDSDPAWRAEYEKALAEAEANGIETVEAIGFATVTADMAITKAEEAKTAQAEAIEQARARAAADPEPDPAPAPDADPGAAARRAVAAINASRGHVEQPEPDQAIQEATEAEEPDPNGNNGDGASAAAKAVAAINARRGV